MATTIKQGDAYSLPVEVKNGSDAINISDIAAVEFMLGDLRKLYPDEVTYNNTDGKFYIPLTQAETFAFEVGNILLDIRVKFTGGNVEGIPSPIAINVVDAVSEVAL